MEDLMKTVEECYDVIVVGAGHAGCEAALAAARLGCETIIFTVSMNSVALMPCNPNIGGSSKGHLVKEIDALGGEMGKNIDKTYIQSKMLNKSKGPAVHSLRAQADKDAYSMTMRYTLQNTDHLTLRQAEVTELIVEDGSIRGVKTFSGARIDKRSVNFDVMEEQFGDEKIVPFSFTNKEEDIKREQISCWLTYTNEETHKIIRDNLDRSPIYAGVIEGTGPRYCPSIEDKVVRFADRKRHQLFIEPEGEFTNEMYVGGMSSSLPEDVQYEMYRTVKGLENVKIIRNAYAIEYDCINPNQLKLSLEFRNIQGLFSGGQFNGSSGYEEAACQGLIAGINAARKCTGKEPVILDRSQAYIGVLIDDLVTKENHEPYRMMTSRAEYRLLLRQDNADMRLTPIGHEIGLIDDERYEKFLLKKDQIEKEIERLKHVNIGANKTVQELLVSLGSSQLNSGSTLEELIKRPELNYESLASIDPGREPLDDDVIEQININIKYEGYIKRQLQQVEQFKKMENKLIPDTINYDEVHNLRNEAVQKLKAVHPHSVGQASRISGVSPSDISVLMIYMEQMRHKK